MKNLFDEICDDETGIWLPMPNIKGEVEAIEKELNFELPDNVSQKDYDNKKILYTKNVTQDNLLALAGAEMFLYLCTCSGTFKPWLQYYSDLFHNDSPDNIFE